MSLHQTQRQVALLRREVAELARRVPRDMPPQLQRWYADAHARADSAYRAMGHANGAPAPRPHEAPSQYTRRRLAPLQRHSPAWKRANLARMPVAHEQIYADALKADRTIGKPGELRPKVKTDITGRQITKFYCDPQAWLAPIRANVHYVPGITVPKGQQ